MGDRRGSHIFLPLLVGANTFLREPLWLLDPAPPPAALPTWANPSALVFPFVKFWFGWLKTKEDWESYGGPVPRWPIITHSTADVPVEGTPGPWHPCHVGSRSAGLQRETHPPWRVMKTAQQGRGDGAPAEQTAAPMGPGLAFPLWSKPDTWAFFPLAAQQAYRQGPWVSMMYRRGSAVCAHTSTSAHARKRVFHTGHTERATASALSYSMSRLRMY